MKLHLHKFKLRLRHKFRISRGSCNVQRTLVVELEEDGLRGYGEAAPNRFYGVSIRNMTAALKSVKSQLDSQSFDDPVALWHRLDPQLRHNRFAQCALDQAAHDLWGKKLGQPVYRLWELSTDNLPASNYTIGIADTDVIVATLQESAAWPTYKIKLGTSRDLEVLRELRRHTEAPFRVDANCAWSASQTIANAREMKDLNVEFIEQPLPVEADEEIAAVARDCEIPVIADESCQVETDVPKCKQAGFHGVNIKLVKCGGLTPARRMIRTARELGLRVMVGCMTESTIGISAIAQLLPLLDYVDMDSAAFLSNDIATGVKVDRGVCHYPQENGCGVKLL